MLAERLTMMDREGRENDPLRCMSWIEALFALIICILCWIAGLDIPLGVC